MVTVTAGLYKVVMFVSVCVCVCVWGRSRKGECQCVCSPRGCVYCQHTLLKTTRRNINGGGNELSLKTIGQTSQPGYMGLRESILPTEEKTLKHTETYTLTVSVITGEEK